MSEFCLILSLVNAFKDCTILTYLALSREYKILNLLEFNSTRKRMSVVVEDNTGQITIMCKGADRLVYMQLPCLCWHLSVQDKCFEVYYHRDYSFVGEALNYFVSGLISCLIFYLCAAS
jgi:hypothetical protein